MILRKELIPKVRLQLHSPADFRKVQTVLRNGKITFTSFTLPEDRILKVVVRGIPTDISKDEVTAELELRGFTVKNVKRFDANSRPLPTFVPSYSIKKYSSRYHL